MYSHFNDLYGSIFHNNQNSVDDVYDEYIYMYNNDLDCEFTENEIKQAVFSQNNSKSPGSDQFISEIFKYSFDIISHFLVRFYNKILNEGSFPLN